LFVIQTVGGYIAPGFTCLVAQASSLLFQGDKPVEGTGRYQRCNRLVLVSQPEP